MQPNKQEIINYLKDFASSERYNRIQDIVRKRTRHITIVVENLFQSHNISAILRTAECLGIQDVHIIENNFEYTINKQVSLGAQKWLSVYHYNHLTNNTVSCLQTIKEKGYKIIATLPQENNYSLEDVPLDAKTAFLFGTELNGLSPEAINMADSFIKIPMYGFTESYNVSVSVALTMMNVNERLRKSSFDWALSTEEIMDLELDWLKKSIKDAERILKRFFNR
ncbi:MAG: RNA methyltransferase [Bacteroidales bacterium]|jgi:tRNA (guanosine-2'-O-)-methyltransferase|nr:RNA methyltransferase [Bacteroidales bacterium]